jgi:hypothetical protein
MDCINATSLRRKSGQMGHPAFVAVAKTQVWFFQRESFRTLHKRSKGLRPVFFGPGIRISCKRRHQHPRVRLSLRKAA